MDDRARSALFRIAAMFGALLIATIAGLATSSFGVFVVIVIVGLVAVLALRLAGRP